MPVAQLDTQIYTPESKYWMSYSLGNTPDPGSNVQRVNFKYSIVKNDITMRPTLENRGKDISHKLSSVFHKVDGPLQGG